MIQRKRTLEEIDCNNRITEKDRIDYPGIHFCVEWDEMLIHKGAPEWDACLCYSDNEEQISG